MLIGIDGNEANIENRVGVNQYAYELLWGIYKLQDEWKPKHELVIYLKNKPLPDLPKETINFRYKIIPGSQNWLLTKLSFWLFKNPEHLDIFFSPSHYIPVFSSVPRVCSIMDLGYLEFSEQFRKRDYWQLKLWTAYSLRVSKAIIAISNSTKEDIVRHYPFASGKTFVTHLAYDTKQFNLNIRNEDVRRIKNKYSIVGDYILYLGTLKPSKNIESLVEAYRLIKDKYNIKLVIAGKKGWLYESIFDRVKKLGLEMDVVFTGYVSDQEKPVLIKGAKVFCLPSFWEGFGLDVLNAFASGVPAVISNRGSLPEIAGKAGVVVNPEDFSSIAEGIINVLSASEIAYNKLVSEGVKRAEDFSWEKTAEKTLEILEHVQR